MKQVVVSHLRTKPIPTKAYMEALNLYFPLVSVEDANDCDSEQEERMALTQADDLDPTYFARTRVSMVPLRPCKCAILCAAQFM